MTVRKAMAFLESHPETVTVNWLLPDGRISSVFRWPDGSLGVYIGDCAPTTQAVCR